MKITPITLILLLLTNVFYSQTQIVHKDVEHRMGQNQKLQIQEFEGIYVVYSFKNINIEKRSQSESFDHLLLKNNQLKIKSCATSEVNGVFNTVIIAHGFVTSPEGSMPRTTAATSRLGLESGLGLRVRARAEGRVSIKVRVPWLVVSSTKCAARRS